MTNCDHNFFNGGVICTFQYTQNRPRGYNNYKFLSIFIQITCRQAILIAI